MVSLWLSSSVVLNVITYLVCVCAPFPFAVLGLLVSVFDPCILINLNLKNISDDILDTSSVIRITLTLHRTHRIILSND